MKADIAAPARQDDVTNFKAFFRVLGSCAEKESSVYLSLNTVALARVLTHRHSFMKRRAKLTGSN